MIVADANLVACLVLQESEQELAVSILKVDSTWSVPMLWRSEMLNILAGLMRGSGLSRKSAAGLYTAAADLLMANECVVNPERILSCIARSRCTAYDCEYVALAESLDQLVTSTGTAGFDNGIAEAGALGELLSDLLLQQEIHPGRSQIDVLNATGHGPGVKTGECALLWVHILNIGAGVLHGLDLLLSVIGPDQCDVIALVELQGLVGRCIETQHVPLEGRQFLLDLAHLFAREVERILNAYGECREGEVVLAIVIGQDFPLVFFIPEKSRNCREPGSPCPCHI